MASLISIYALQATAHGSFVLWRKLRTPGCRVNVTFNDTTVRSEQGNLIDESIAMLAKARCQGLAFHSFFCRLNAQEGIGQFMRINFLTALFYRKT